MKHACKNCESYDPEKLSIDDDPESPGDCLKGCCRWSDPTTVVFNFKEGDSRVISGWPHVDPDDRCGFFEDGKD